MFSPEGLAKELPGKGKNPDVWILSDVQRIYPFQIKYLQKTIQMHLNIFDLF